MGVKDFVKKITGVVNKKITQISQYKERPIVTIKDTGGHVSETETTTGRGPTWIGGSEAPKSKGGGGGGGGSGSGSGSGSTSSSAPTIIQGPLPKGTTPQEEKTFRTSGVTATRLKPSESKKYYIDKTTQEPKSIGLVKPGYITPVKLSLSSGIAGSFKNLFSRFSTTNKRTSWENILDPLDRSAQAKFEKTAYTTTKVGSISPGESTFKDITYGDLQFKRDINILKETSPKIGSAKKDIENYYKDLQSNVNKGTISLGVAKTLGEQKVGRVSEQLNKDIGDVYKKYPGVQGLGEKKSDIRNFIKGVAYSNPLTTAIVIADESKKSPLKPIDINAPLQTYPDIKLTTEGKIASGFVVGGALVGASKFGIYGLTEKAIVTKDVAQLSKQPWATKSLVLIGDKTGKLLYKGERNYFGLKQKVNLAGKLYKIGSKKYIIPEGVGVLKTVGKLPWNIMGGGKSTQLISSSAFSFGEKGVSLGLEKVSIGVSKNVFIPKISSSAMFQIPSTKKQAIKTGKSIGKQWYKNVEYGGTGIISYDVRPSIKVGKDLYFGFTPNYKREISEYGLTKVIYPKPTSSVKVFRGGGGAKTPLSKTFGITETKSPMTISPGKGAMGQGLKSETISISKVFSKGRIGTRSGIKSFTKQSTRQLGLGNSKSALSITGKSILSIGTKLKSRQGIVSVSGIALGQPQVPKVRTTTSFFYPGIVTPKVSPKPPRIGTPSPYIPFIPFGLPKPSLNFKFSPGGKRVGGSPLSGYSTSFTGYTLGIKGSKPKLFAGKYLTGFEVRPLSKKGKIVFEVNK